ncbi:HCL342Wp [Eremothecium sinecaudum]|uniref:Glucosidase II subunit alpha n=1 Tax=Eremothecium sinecaudum TaxID=45286 RepID=A0A109UYD8_9SACH|nr:HCL342Wp [Eremothecium sinecaudum]AMD19809.1 HCL342Wp [Eremothecium sinecaudum]
MWWKNCLGLLVLLQQVTFTVGVDTVGFDYKQLATCETSGTCNRNKIYAKNIENSKANYYSIDANSINYEAGSHTLTANVLKRLSRNEDKFISLPFTLDILENSAVRFTIDENRQDAVVPDLLTKNRTRAASEWAFNNVEPAPKGKEKVEISKPSIWNKNDVVKVHDDEADIRIELSLSKFLIKVYYKNQLQITVNERSYLNFEHWKPGPDHTRDLLPDEIAINATSLFQTAAKDTMPFGPESVALDFTFHKYQNVYGIPEHLDTLRLKDTSAGEPYRLFNVDGHAEHPDAVKPTYGAIPFMISSRPGSALGLFWSNAADTWVDVKYDNKDTKTHWMSEAGVLDVVMIVADTPLKVTESFTELTGKPALPQLSSLGYHQCRYSYYDEEDVMNVITKMDEHEMPLDFMWLDLDYTDGRKFFTWKSDAYPDPQRMLRTLDAMGRNLVVIIDPQFKLGYEVSDDLIKNSSALIMHDGSVFSGDGWPGKSIWIDPLSPHFPAVWTGLFKDFIKDSKNLFVWNDMDEPSIFSGPETTSPKDCIQFGGFESRAVHNLYGIALHEATCKALVDVYAAEDKRQFILSRSFFAGSQRTAGTWTGDTYASWEHLQLTIPMLLVSNIVGMPLIGADVGGFFGNPTPELLTRWYQAGMWYPFFRAHADIDTVRREPYLLDEPYRTVVRDVLRLRYSLLPTLYTAFHEASITGAPVLAPVFYEHPELDEVYDIDDQFFVGQQGLMVKPIVEPEISTTNVYFPPGLFYDYWTMAPIYSKKGEYKTLPVSIDTFPLFIESGKIITRRDRHRRAIKLMKHDPFTLVLAPSEQGTANGSLYLDDGETFGYKAGKFLKVDFQLDSTSITGKVSNFNEEFAGLKVENVIIANEKHLDLQDSVTIVQGNTNWTSTVTRTEYYYTIKNPAVVLGSDWKIVF